VLTDFGGSTDRYIGLRAVAANGVTSTGFYTIRYEDTAEPPAPTGFTATPEAWGTTLEWDAPTVADLREYWLYTGRSTTVDGVRTCATGEMYVQPRDRTSVRDVSSLPDGEERCWVLQSVDGANNTSARVTAYATEQDTRPSEPTDPISDEVHGLSVSVSTGVPVLRWYLADGATGYRVYRWDRSTGAYERIAEGPMTAPGDDVVRMYTDEDAPFGTTAYYRVTAVHADGTESAPAGTAVALAPKA
jgi:hypothetical protein